MFARLLKSFPRQQPSERLISALAEQTLYQSILLLVGPNTQTKQDRKNSCNQKLTLDLRKEETAMNNHTLLLILSHKQQQYIDAAATYREVYIYILSTLKLLLRYLLQDNNLLSNEDSLWVGNW